MSIRSTVRRTAASLAIGALATTGLVAVASAPAQAATEGTVATLEMGTTGNATVGAYGSYLSTTGSVKSVTGNSPYAGAVHLQQLVGGTWTTIATDTSPGFAYFPTVSKFTGNASYRLFYEGGSNTSTYNPVTWLPSYSNVVTISTFRALEVSSYKKGRRAGLKAKVSPAKKGLKITLQTKKGGKWKTYKKKKLKNGKNFKTLVSGKNKQKFRFILPGDANFVGTKSPVYTLTHYRY